MKEAGSSKTNISSSITKSVGKLKSERQQGDDSVQQLKSIECICLKLNCKF
jgi:hypothetical protein